ncbi:MAG: SCO family protein [Pacificimonas sp.]
MNTKQPAPLMMALLLAACGQDATAPASTAPVDEPPLAGASIGGDFALQTANGETVSNDSLKGQWRLIYFGYTFCPDICPVDTERMGRAYAAIEAQAPELAGQLTPVFITVDPERDTPEIAGEFAANFHPDMIGLSGSQQAVDDAVNTFRVYKAKGDVRDDGFYLMDHSANIYLFDADGQPISFYERDISADEMARDVMRWIRK